MKSFFVELERFDKIPEPIRADMTRLTEKLKADVNEYISTCKLEKNEMGTVMTNCMLHGLSAILCTMFYSDKDTLKQVELEMDNIANALKQQVVMSYKSRIEKDLKGEKE